MIPDCSPDEFILRKIQQKAASANFGPPSVPRILSNLGSPLVVSRGPSAPPAQLGLLAVYFWRHSLKSLAQRGKQKQRHTTKVELNREKTTKLKPKSYLTILISVVN